MDFVAVVWLIGFRHGVIVRFCWKSYFGPIGGGIGAGGWMLLVVYLLFMVIGAIGVLPLPPFPPPVVGMPPCLSSISASAFCAAWVCRFGVYTLPHFSWSGGDSRICCLSHLIAAGSIYVCWLFGICHIVLAGVHHGCAALSWIPTSSSIGVY